MASVPGFWFSDRVVNALLTVAVAFVLAAVGWRRARARVIRVRALVRDGRGGTAAGDPPVSPSSPPRARV